MRAVVVLVSLFVAAEAHAFCGFYAGSATGELTARVSRVVLVREGTRTVVTMQNHYEGPPEHFALVVPVPEVIQSEQVRALDPAIFDRIDRLTAPRIVAYQQGAPQCVDPRRRIPRIRSGNADVRGVVVEAAFSTAEYDIVVLGASDSTGLEAWLRANGYRVPEGAADVLRPYVAAGTKFFVARVDVSRVRFVDGAAVLSPLRVHYDAPALALPIRLGALNSPGEQDLVVYTIGRTRFEVANRRSFFAPTNVEVAPEAIPRFEALYERVFDRLTAAHPDAVWTEYAWTASGCDPCPPDSTGLDLTDLNALGGDVLESATPHQEGALVVRARATRVDGRGSDQAGVERELARHVEDMERCLGASASGYEMDMELRIRLGRGGLVHVEPEPAARIDALRCVRRQLEGRRIAAPPLNLGSSTWDVLLTLSREVNRRQDSPFGFVVTRLRTRIRKEGRTDDLVFRVARAAYGGRDTPDPDGRMSQHVRLSRPQDASTFQSRFVALHRVDQALECEPGRVPTPGRWGGGRPRPVDEDAAAPTRPLHELIRTPIEALGEVRPRRGRAQKPAARLDPRRSPSVPRERPVDVDVAWLRRDRIARPA